MIENSVAFFKAAEICRAGSGAARVTLAPELPSFAPAHVDGTLVAAESRAA